MSIIANDLEKREFISRISELNERFLMTLDEELGKVKATEEFDELFPTPQLQADVIAAIQKSRAGHYDKPVNTLYTIDIIDYYEGRTGGYVRIDNYVAHWYLELIDENGHCVDWSDWVNFIANNKPLIRILKLCLPAGQSSKARINKND
jgi:hypothetical protein